MLKQGQLERKREDADELITDVLKKVPEEKKREILCVIMGFAMGVEASEKEKNIGKMNESQ